MFRVLGNSACHCDGLTRRGFLQTGVLGLGGLTLPDLLRIRAQAAKPIRDTAVILFWLSGGPGHMETWDPKPGATTEYRGPLGAIRTAVPGIQFGDLFPGQARLMDKLAVVRTVNHGSGDHTKSNHWMLTGHEGPAFNAPDFKQQRRPSLGAVAARLRGPNKPGMPAYAAVPHLRGGTDNFFHYSAYLGGGANPFITESDPNTPQFRVKNLSLPTDMDFRRLESRRRGAERGQPGPPGRRPPTWPTWASITRRAFDLLTSKQVASAFDISAEPARCATTMAGTPSARVPCWPGGWSRPASPSSPSTASPGTITALRRS